LQQPPNRGQAVRDTRGVRPSAFCHGAQNAKVSPAEFLLDPLVRKLRRYMLPL
jgi:hypothetical protein